MNYHLITCGGRTGIAPYPATITLTLSSLAFFLLSPPMLILVISTHLIFVLPLLRGQALAITACLMYAVK